MASAVKLVDGATTYLDVKGIALEGLVIEPRTQQRKITKFWGVNAESHIYGGYGGRTIEVPVLVFDATAYDTAEKLADYIDQEFNGTALGTVGSLEIISLADHDPFPPTTLAG